MDSKSLDIIKTPDDEWRQIVDQLMTEVNAADIPSKVVMATEMLLAGYPTYKVAQKLKIDSSTVRRWLTSYPTMAAVVARGRTLLSTWRMSKLEQQFLAAVERSQEILEIPLNGETADGERVNPKVLTVVAAQARYIIGLFAGQKVDLTVTHELGDTVMKAKQDALSYLAGKLAEQQANSANEPIEATYRIIDAKADATGPLLDEDGNPPYGALGILDRTDDGSLCHICGRRLLDLSRHVLTAHNMSTNEYEDMYILTPGSVRKAYSG